MSRAEANARRSDLGQRGSVSAEAALVVPVLVLIILGGVHFGKVLMLRHQLAAATDVATRTAALAQTPDATVVQNMIQTELGSSAGFCSTLAVSTNQERTLGVDRVEVSTTCTVDRDRFTTKLTGFLGPDQLTVRVAMPM